MSSAEDRTTTDGLPETTATKSFKLEDSKGIVIYDPDNPEAWIVAENPLVLE